MSVFEDLFGKNFRFFDDDNMMGDLMALSVNVPAKTRLEIMELQKQAQKEMDNLMAVPALPPSGAPNRNYESVIFSRLSVNDAPHRFDLVKVHRSRDGSKFFVFVVIENRWTVIEDDATLFPSDQLITALRVLQF